MNIRVLGAFGGEGLGHRPSSFLVNDRLLVDGGSVTGALTVPEQLVIEHALVSHAHLDHIAGLVYLTETLGFCESGAAVTIASIDPVITTLRAGVFNNVLWPDFSRIPHADVPVVKYRTLVEDVEQRVG
ncbi:MAG TPA: MBL fold metallo-hydrolase, partial [Candidatus Rokubacteria bacterium]|nr:MBL fold metallo-hydrolase [Candidatus Rokubacteria bacterium]